MAGNGVRLADQTIFIDAAVETVYELLSDPTKLAEWLVDEPSFVHGAGLANEIPADSQLNIVETVPGKRIVLDWSFSDAAQPRIPQSTVEILLEPQADGTLVRLQQFVVRDQDYPAGVGANEFLGALAQRIKAAFRTPLPVPSFLGRMAAATIFLEPRGTEGAFAYASRRVASAASAAAIVGAIAVTNLMLVNPGASSLQSALAWGSFALLLLLANVYLQTVIGLALRSAAQLQKGALLILSGFAALASCYAYFWPAAGAVFGASDRATTWVTIALATPVLVLLYAKAFDAEVLRRSLRHPAGRGADPRPFTPCSAVLALACCCCQSLRADEPASPVAEKIHQLVAHKYEMDAPGAAVLVAKGGEVIINRGYGVADLERHEPITGDTTFCIASVTKPITATAVLRLVEQGKLNLDQKVVDILPDYPTHAADVTVDNLLSHTAGIPDVSRLPKWRADMKSELTVPQILDYFQALPLSFAPGDQWRYSNSGYLLLGAVIERVSGRNYGDFLTEEIFEMADMRSSHYGPSKVRSERHALGYQRGGDAYVEADPVSLSRPFAAGGVVSTANDLFAFSRALTAGQLISRETLDKAFSPCLLNSGEPTTYGHGWMVGTFHGHRVVQHAGGMPGYSAQMWLLPDDEIFAVVLSNAPDKTDQKLIGQLVSVALGESVGAQKTIRVDAATLEKYVGRYQLSDFGNDVVTVSLTDGRLTMHVPPNPVCELHATAPNEFFVTEEDIQLTFVVDSKGVVQSVVLHHGGLDLYAARLAD
jgi:D-alanyl-D-alanine carboxypeptidase